MSPDAVTRHLLERSQVRFSRASGPGGQHRDHTESRAELVIGRQALEGLPEQVAARLLDRLHLAKRPLRLASQNDRSRDRNRATVERALLTRVEAALRPRTVRRPTRPSASSVARRLDQKAGRARTKALRRQPDAD